jgi:predicted permease
VTFSPLELPRADEIALDLNVVVVALVLSVVAALALMAIPLLQRDRDASSALRDGGRSVTAGRARLRFRGALMACQVALALMLLAGSGLLLRSYLHVREADTGFRTRDALLFSIGLSTRDFPTRERAEQFHDELAQRVAALPGVRSVGFGTCLPLDGYCWGERASAEGASLANEEEAGTVVSMRRVSPGFFTALQLPMVAGRPFLPDDHDTRVDVVVLSRATAQRLFPGQDAVGRRVTIGGGSDGQPYTVVGVAADAPSRSVTETAPELVFYLPIRDARDNEGTVTIHGMRFVVRTEGDPAPLLPAIRAIVQQLDPGTALANARTLQEVLASDRANITFTTALLLLAAVVAMMLGGLGIYAVVSHVVGRRTAEIGLRLALGAGIGDVLRIVFRQAGLVTLIGVIAGLAGAALLTRSLSSLLFGVAPLDAGVFLLATVALLLVAACATALPARRAWRLRPLDALRVE